jgi:hypothetical protein
MPMIAMVLNGVMALAVAQEAPHLTLQGSPEAMAEQHQAAVEHGLSFYETREEVEAALQAGELVQIPGSEYYEVADFVVPPYIHPDALHFVERTARLYVEACAEPLVVTSAVRSRANQPRNAHELSVHPAGIAVDFRVSQTPECREWFEEKLLALEEQDVVNATRERSPPHYHVAVYPEPYLAYVAANPLPAMLQQAQGQPGQPGQQGDEVTDAAASFILWVSVFAAVLLLAGTVYVIWRREAKRRQDPPRP